MILMICLQMDLALNNLQLLICHETKSNQTKILFIFFVSSSVVTCFFFFLGSTRGGMVKVLGCHLVVNVLKLSSRYFIHFELYPASLLSFPNSLLFADASFLAPILPSLMLPFLSSFYQFYLHFSFLPLFPQFFTPSIFPFFNRLSFLLSLFSFPIRWFVSCLLLCFLLYNHPLCYPFFLQFNLFFCFHAFYQYFQHFSPSSIHPSFLPSFFFSNKLHGNTLQQPFIFPHAGILLVSCFPTRPLF